MKRCRGAHPTIAATKSNVSSSPAQMNPTRSRWENVKSCWADETSKINIPLHANCNTRLVLTGDLEPKDDGKGAGDEELQARAYDNPESCWNAAAEMPAAKDKFLQDMIYFRSSSFPDL